MSQGLYLYCLARLSRLPALPLEGQGLDGRSPLEVGSYKDLAAVWSPAPLEDFCGPDAAARMQDLNWIGPRLIRHQEVVVEVMRHSPVLPARFATLFASSASLEKVLQHHHDTIAGFLERVTDREEWAVKGMLDRSGAQEKLFSLTRAREAARLGALTPGTRYFHEQRLRAGCDQELQVWLKEVCGRLWTDVRDYAAEVRERRLLSREATGSARDMVLNWALLLPRSAVSGFQALIQDVNSQYDDRGLRLESTGPWPPYSFTPVLDMESEA